MDERRELDHLARTLGLELHRGFSDGSYKVERNGTAIYYAADDLLCKAFLRGYQHGRETA